MSDTQTTSPAEIAYHSAMHKLYRAVREEAKNAGLPTDAFLFLWQRAQAEMGWEVPA